MTNAEVRPLMVSASRTIAARAKRDAAFVREVLAEAERLEHASELLAATMLRESVNPTVARKEQRQLLDKQKLQCSRCPPHDGENRSRRARDDKYKTARKGRGRVS
jgi:hypothetical protein